MAEHRRRNDHAGVITAAKYFYIGAAGQRGLHAYQNIALANLRDGYRLNL